MKPDLWSILAKKQSFLGLKTFPKKKNLPKSLETTVGQRWFQNYLCETPLMVIFSQKTAIFRSMKPGHKKKYHQNDEKSVKPLRFHRIE